MALVLADRVRDTTTTTGTGTVTLSGTAPTGYQTFGAAIGNGNTTYYTINAGSQWEVGLGTYSSTGPTLARTTVLASSNGGSLVDFSAGTKDVFVTYPAEKSVNQDASGNVGIGTTSPTYRLDVASADTTANLGYAMRIRANATAGGGTFQFTDSGATAQWGFLAATATSVTLDATNASILGFRTNNNERMRIDSSGNVGIGTNSPGYPLTVQANSGSGAVRLVGRSADSVSTLEFINSTQATTQAYIQSGSTPYLAFATSTTERMRIDSSGNVGIGTSSPGNKLSVNGDASFGDSIFMGTGVSTGDCKIELGSNRSAAGNAYIDFHALAGQDYNGRLIRTSGANGSFEITNAGTGAMTFSTNNGERMRIDGSSGNMLLGTTTAKNRLTVTAGANTNSPTLGSAGGIAYFTNTDVAYGLNVGTSAADGHTWLQAQRTDGTATSYNLTLNEAGGNVGIGTSSPGAVLQLNKASGAADLRLSVGGTLYTNIYASSSDVNILGITAIPLILGTNNTERMRIGSNGSVAIGGTGTDASLHIQQAYGGYDRLTQMSPNTASKNAFNLMAAKNSGSTDLWWSWGVRNDNVWCLEQGVNYSMNSATGFFYDSGGQAYKSGGGSWAATSDARVKTNITPISDAASRIMALKPSSFDYRAPEAHAGRVSDRGFIAQDFEEVYPHSVSESAMVADAEKAFVTGDDKIKAISLNNDFFADLVALVQEQQTIINDLRARVAELEGN